VILKKMTEAGVVGTTVPLHRELKPGTLHGILKLAKISLDEFMAAL
jgi:predicted RNA binding protein YcfA (HicA-like mRNA interferase family)